MSPKSRGKLFLLVAEFLLLIVVVTIARDVVARRLLLKLAQRTLNNLASASIDSIGRFEVTAEGNVVVHRAVVSTMRAGKRRVFFKSERIEIHVDGNPLRDRNVSVRRVDLIRPEMNIVRERDADWNVLWALLPAGTGPEASAPAPPAGPPEPYRDPFPRNGVHIYKGTFHITFVGDNDHETIWNVDAVEGIIRRAGKGMRFEEFAGTFYGGRFRGEATVPSYEPFVMEMKIDIAGADVALMAAKLPVVTIPVSGKFDMVLSTRSEAVINGGRPISSGRVAITGGKLWDLPPFVAVLAAFALTPSGDMIIDETHIDFTMERDVVRIDRMDFLGRPLSLFGSGTMGVDGSALDVTCVPRVGKGFGDIVPLAGHLVQGLLDLIKGAIIPLRIGGTFWKPTLGVDKEAPLSDAVKQALEEHK